MTGSTVYGLKPGLQHHLGGGASLMYIQGNPSGIVYPAQVGGLDMNGQSGATLAFDTATNIVYQYAQSGLWLQLGSCDFT